MAERFADGTGGCQDGAFQRHPKGLSLMTARHNHTESQDRPRRRAPPDVDELAHGIGAAAVRFSSSERQLRKLANGVAIMRMLE
jgi:hypothetical protein